MKLENHFHDMQDMEFTIEEGKLYFLQTRNGKRTAPAAIQIACDLVDEGQITPEEAVCRIEAKSLDQLLHPTFDPAALKAGEVIGQALPASPGAAAGKVCFDCRDCQGCRHRRQGRESNPGSSGDISGGYRGYARCTGYPDCTRRYDLPRSSSCPWYGYLLCIRLRRDQDRRREEGILPLADIPSTKAITSP